MAYSFDLPTRIEIREGCSGQLGQHVIKILAKHVLCVFDKGIEAAGFLDPIVKNLEAAGLEEYLEIKAAIGRNPS